MNELLGFRVLHVYGTKHGAACVFRSRDCASCRTPPYSIQRLNRFNRLLLEGSAENGDIAYIRSLVDLVRYLCSQPFLSSSGASKGASAGIRRNREIGTYFTISTFQDKNQGN
ncbi:hypothetical protein VTH06DRAFT_2150 [Thermothelomyces fergusii]